MVLTWARSTDVIGARSDEPVFVRSQINRLFLVVELEIGRVDQGSQSTLAKAILGCTVAGIATLDSSTDQISVLTFTGLDLRSLLKEQTVVGIVGTSIGRESVSDSGHIGHKDQEGDEELHRRRERGG